jgi:hypothetical protein
MDDVDEAVITEADWWVGLHDGAARWRTSRTVQWCANQRLPSDHATRCDAGPAVPAIEPGSRYFDTGELVEPPWRTLHLCLRCASRIWA